MTSSRSPTTRRPDALAPMLPRLLATPPDTQSVVPAGEMRVLAMFTSARRDGPITWAPLVRVRAWFADLTLDLREGHLPPHCTIDLSAWLSEVTIIVPPGVHLRSDLYTLLAEEHTKRKGPPQLPAPDAPVVEVLGTAHIAEVRLRVNDRLPYAQLVRLIGAVQAAGLSRIGFESEAALPGR